MLPPFIFYLVIVARKNISIGMAMIGPL